MCFVMVAGDVWVRCYGMLMVVIGCNVWVGVRWMVGEWLWCGEKWFKSLTIGKIDIWKNYY